MYSCKYWLLKSISHGMFIKKNSTLNLVLFMTVYNTTNDYQLGLQDRSGYLKILFKELLFIMQGIDVEEFLEGSNILALLYWLPKFFANLS